MKSFIFTLSLFICLTLGVSKVWALPDCTGSDTSLWNDCVGTNYTEFTGKYVGEFKDGARHGQGTITFADGSKYVGELEEGMFHGQGTVTWSDGDKYVGKFVASQRHGYGISTFADGDKYVGEHEEGWLHGLGTYTFADGSKWVGTWEWGYLNGYAITYYADGSINKKGIFKDDVFMYAQKKSKTDSFKEFCEDLGFKLKTEGFGNCVLKMMELNKD